MALYKPTQRIDFLYISSHNAIYVKATVTVPLDVNEYIPTPPPNDVVVNKNDIDILLRAINPPSEDGRYFQTMPVLVWILDAELGDSPSKLNVENAIGDNVYTVTTAVYKGATEKGKVTTTSQNAEIEIT